MLQRCSLLKEWLEMSWLLFGEDKLQSLSILQQPVERMWSERRYDFLSKPMLKLILGWYVVFKVYRDSIIFSYYLGSSGTTTPVAQQNGTVPATNGTGGATHSDESDGQTGPAGHPTQAQQNQSNSTEPLPAGYEKVVTLCNFMLNKKLMGAL